MEVIQWRDATVGGAVLEGPLPVLVRYKGEYAFDILDEVSVGVSDNRN
jgi:hypothetical protein